MLGLGTSRSCKRVILISMLRVAAVTLLFAGVAMGDLRKPLTDQQIQDLEAKWDEVNPALLSPPQRHVTPHRVHWLVQLGEREGLL